MKHTPEAAALTNLILEVFRLNGQLLIAGDRLTQPIELTSARWQVLGAINLAGHPISVAQIGRRMGITRQAVQRIANDLKALGFVTFESNPDHVRAKLVVPSTKGWEALNRINAIQIKWSNALTKDMDAARLIETVEVLRELRSRCETTETTPMNEEVQANAQTY